MRRVTGIGGIFMTAQDPEALREWYRTHLGIDVQEWGGAVFRWAHDDGAPAGGTTVWSLAGQATSPFEPSAAPFMVNYRVADLDALRDVLRAEGCDVLERTECSEFGKFGWVMDPEGNKVELWEPPLGQ